MKRFIAILLAVIVLMAALPMTAYAGGVEEEELDVEDMRFISLSDLVEDYYGVGEDKSEYVEYNVYSKQVVSNDAYPGVTYDRTTNTLTLDNVDRPYLNIFCGNMGDDFKILVVGDCVIASITLNIYSDDCCIDFEGSGKLVVNKTLQQESAIRSFTFTQNESRVTFGKDVTVELYGEENAAYITGTSLEKASDVFVFNGPHTSEPVLKELEDKGYEYETLNGYRESINNYDSWNLGHMLTRASDPEGIYTALYFTTSDDNGVITGDGYYVSKHIYSEACGLYFFDLSYYYGGNSMSMDEFEDSDFEFVTDDEGDNIDLYNDGYTGYTVGYVICKDDKGNTYVKGQEYNFADDEYVTVVARYEPIPDIEGGYIFTPVDMTLSEIESLSVLDGTYMTGYYLEPLFNNVYMCGYVAVSSEDPDGIYSAERIEDYDYWTDQSLGYKTYVNKFVYYDKIGGYLRDYSFGEYGSLRLTDEEFEASPYSYLLSVTGDKIEFTTSISTEYNYFTLYTDASGSEYAVLNYNDDKLVYTFEPIDVLEDRYWMTPAEGVDPETLTAVGHEEVYGVYRNVYLEGSYFGYNVSEPGSGVVGDSDTDGDVTILDATTIQRHLAGLPTSSYNDALADADEDGDVTILDATAVQRWLAGLPTAGKNIGTAKGAVSANDKDGMPASTGRKEMMFLVPTGENDDALLYRVSYDPISGKGYASYTFTDEELAALSDREIVKLDEHFTEVTDKLIELMYDKGMPELSMPQKAQWFGEILLHFYGLFISQQLAGFDIRMDELKEYVEMATKLMLSFVSANLEYTKGSVDDKSHGLVMGKVIDEVSQKLGWIYYYHKLV